MENIEKIKIDLKEKLSEKRYLHSLGTMNMAIKLANIYHIDTNIAALTGLAHDIGKELSNEEKIKFVDENNIETDVIERNNVGLLHGKIGAEIVKNEYNFSRDMLEAIKYHTTANIKMSMLDKIIFVSDKIEETRNYENINELRKLAENDIDECILEILSFSIKDNIEKGKLIHPNSILARNEILINKKLKNNNE